MTEKRFTVNYRENTRLYEVKDNLHILDCGGFAIEYSAKKCCEELNALHEENEQLKYNYNEKCNEYCGLEEQVDILLKENEKLKSDVYDWKASAEDYLKLGKSLKKENEQLKSSDTITDLETEIMKLKQENDQLKKEVEDLKQAVIRAAFGG